MFPHLICYGYITRFVKTSHSNVMRLCILFCSLLVPVRSQDTKARESRLVQIESGLVRGYKDTHDDVFVFYGIPYATAPNGSERFQAKNI